MRPGYSMSHETRKAIARRWREDDAGVFPWRKWMKGRGVDIGCGDDRVALDNFIGFDQKDGDANRFSSYFPKEHFSVIHGSHVLEHMLDPSAAIRDWLKALKPGGLIIQTVPDWFSYERAQWPSRFNPDHKSSWSMIYKGSIAPIHIHIPTFLNDLRDVAVPLLARYVEENYDWQLDPKIDQTWEPSSGVEIWNEFVIRKNKWR